MTFNCKLFLQNDPCVASSEFTSDYNKSKAFYEQQKSYNTIFWNGDSYYPAGILPVQSQQ